MRTTRPSVTGNAEVAKRPGMSLEFVKDDQEVLNKAPSRPSLIIFDLNFDAVNPLSLIGTLKGNKETKSISLLA